MEHQEIIKKNHRTPKQYLCWQEVKRTMSQVKRQIGENSYNLVMDELYKLDRKKIDGMGE